VEKSCSAGQTTNDNIIRCTRIACGITKAADTGTLRICNTYCFSTATMVGHDYAFSLRYTYIACLIDSFPDFHSGMAETPFFCDTNLMQCVNNIGTKRNSLTQQFIGISTTINTWATCFDSIESSSGPQRLQIQFLQGSQVHCGIPNAYIRVS